MELLLLFVLGYLSLNVAYLLGKTRRLEKRVIQLEKTTKK